MIRDIESLISGELGNRSVAAQKAADARRQQKLADRAEDSERKQVISERTTIIKRELAELVGLLILKNVRPTLEATVMGVEKYKYYFGHLSFLKIGLNTVVERNIKIGKKPIWVVEENHHSDERTLFLDPLGYFDRTYDDGLGLTNDGEVIKWERRPYGGEERITGTLNNEELTSRDIESKIVTWGANLIEGRVAVKSVEHRA